MTDEEFRTIIGKIRECAEQTVKVIERALTIADAIGQDNDQALWQMRTEFLARAANVLVTGNTLALEADYSNYLAVLVTLAEARTRIAELEEAVAMRDDVIAAMSDLGSL